MNIGGSYFVLPIQIYFVNLSGGKIAKRFYLAHLILIIFYLYLRLMTY